MGKIKHTLLKFSDLVFMDDNPRRISEADFEALAESIRKDPEFFENRPCLVNHTDGKYLVYAGFQRAHAAHHRLGWVDIPCSIQADVPEAVMRERAIRDNTHQGTWNADVLSSWEFEVPELQAFGVPDFVFGEPDNSLNSEKLEAQEDDYKIPDEIKTDIVTGDLFEIGPHRLLCGDSTSADDVGRLMNGERALLCHADPPYGMGKESDGVLNDNLYGTKLDAFQLLWWSAFRPYLTDNASVYIWGNAEDLWRLWFASELSKREKMYVRNEIVWDKKCIPGMKSDLMTQYAMATERCLYIQLGEQFIGNLNSDQYFDGWDEIRIPLEKMAEDAALTPSKLKELCGVGMYSHWFTKSQWCFIPKIHYNRLKEAFPASFNLEYEKLWAIYGRIKGGYRNHINGIVGGMRSYFDNGHDIMYDVWSFSRVMGEERGGHATPKPVTMTGRCIKSSSPEDAIVVEPFLGSGTTMVAAHQLNRRCYGMEIDPKYCQVIVDRMIRLDQTLEIKRNGQPYNKLKN